MNHLLVFTTAFIAAALALLSGFGLGTILTPVFLLFYDAKISISISTLSRSTGFSVNPAHLEGAL